MKVCLVILAIAIAFWISVRLFGQSGSPVSVQLTEPTQGQVVSNTITLSATATGTVAPIQRVEFYVDGVLVGTVFAKPSTPLNPILTKL